MNVEKFIRNEKTVAVITGTEKVLTDVQSALDLIMTAKYEVGTNLIAIEKSAVADDFFILSRGLAGEILEKFITYQAKLAIFGDYSHYTSKPLKDFIYESNKGNAFWEKQGFTVRNDLTYRNKALVEMVRKDT